MAEPNTRLWAWVVIGPGGEEIVPMRVLYAGHGPSPLIATNEDELDQITKHAVFLARQGEEVVLWEFTERREVRRIGGAK